MTLVSFDYAMKKILREKTNFDILEGFLSELLSTQITIKQLLESESNKDHKDDKQNRVDILAEDGDKRLILIEVQKSSEVDYFQRMLFAASRLVTEYLQQGQSYGLIRKVITVNIVYFELGQGLDYLYHGSTNFAGIHRPDDILMPSKHQTNSYSIKHVSDIFPEHWIIKLQRFDDVAKDKLDEWIYFLKNSKIEKGFSAQGLKQAKIKLDQIKLSENDYDSYRSYNRQLREEASFAYNAMHELQQYEAKGRAEGETRGEARGRAEGEARGRAEIAKKMKGLGNPAALIMEVTGLTLEEINLL